jgi:hypothetical protein
MQGLDPTAFSFADKSLICLLLLIAGIRFVSVCRLIRLYCYCLRHILYSLSLGMCIQYPITDDRDKITKIRNQKRIQNSRNGWYTLRCRFTRTKEQYFIIYLIFKQLILDTHRGYTDISTLP